MLLSIKQIIKPNEKEKIILGNLSYSAYKLWNVANYEKKNYKALGLTSFPNWYEQKKHFKNNFWYKNLPSQTAQEVLNTLQQAWKSYFKLIKTKGIINPQTPRFKKSLIDCKSNFAHPTNFWYWSFGIKLSCANLFAASSCSPVSFSNDIP